MSPMFVLHFTFESLRSVLVVGIVTEFAVERGTCGRGPVQGWRLLNGVITKSIGDQVFSVCGAQVEGVGAGGLAESRFLKRDVREA